VIEVAQYAAGPFAGQLLADLGADVVKIERPGNGDLLRSWGPFLDGAGDEPFSASFAALNRNKRSVALDIGEARDVLALKQLVKNADVFLENFRPGFLRRMGIGYDDLRPANPRLVYCSVTGYGQSGPYTTQGAFDVTVQASSGIMSVTGEEDGEPVKCGVPVADFGAALYAALGILAAVLQARETGEGEYLDCPMLGCMLGISALQTSEYFATGIPPGRLGSRHPKNAPYQGFQAKDAKFVVAAGNDKLWHGVCDVVGRPQFKEDARFASVNLRAGNQRQLADLLQPIFADRPAREWLEAFNARGIPCAPVNSFKESLDDPQVHHMRLVQELPLPNGASTKTVRFPVTFARFVPPINGVPRLGEHTGEVLREWTDETRG
jgi:crotonobetainyl-CoA:carnitine CoA-transferase CaiB-like acyl-CoA transferase